MRRLFVVIAIAIVGAVCLPAVATHALSSDPNVFISGDNVFYAYVKGGEKISASFERVQGSETIKTTADITLTLDGPDFPQKTCVLKKDIPVGQGCDFGTQTATKSGIWRIQFLVPKGVIAGNVSPVVRWERNWFSWNITVSSSKGVEQHGRLWTERYATRQPLPAGEIADITNYYISEDGYIYRAISKGYNGQLSTLSADSFGIRKGNDCVSAYRSVEVSDKNYSPALGTCGNAYKLFFEEPSGILPTKATRWDNTDDWVRPNITKPSIAELHFESDGSSDQLSGTISFYLRNFIGQYQVQVDVDNDGGFDGQNDVTLNEQMKRLSNGLQSVHFQGVDKSGQIIPTSRKIGIKVNITKVAEIHLVAADVEGRVGGLELVRLSGENAPTTRICWNDTELSALPINLMTKTLDGRDCPISTGGVHGWSYANTSWGNSRYIDDWVYASAKLIGQNQIVYPKNEAEAAKAGKQNWALMAFVFGGIIVVGTVVFVVIRGRRKKVQPPTQPAATQFNQPLMPPANQVGQDDQPPDPDRY